MPELASRLLGRTAELAALTKALDGAAGGRLHAVLVTGEAGIGKSRLLEEFVGVATARGTRPLVGHCLHLETCSLPFGPFVEMLRLAGTGPDTTAGPLAALAEGARPTGTTGPADHEEGEPAELLATTRVFGLVLRHLRELSASSPLALVLEDVHWIDTSSLDLLRFLLVNLADDPVLLLLSCRSDELPVSDPRLVEVRELCRPPCGDEVHLGPLTPRDVADLVVSVRGATVRPEVVGQVVQASDGNPFYVEELLAAGFPEVAVRDTRLRGLLLSKVTALSPPGQAVLSLAAVGGPHVDHEVLEAAWGSDDALLAAALHECLDRHLLVLDPDGASVVFRHALLRAAVLSHLLPGQRRRLSERLAAGAATLPAPAPATTLSAASYWYEAGRWPEALTAGVAAARLCVQRHGFAEAHALFTRVLELWDRVDEEQRPDLVRADLLVETAEAARLACDPASGVDLVRQALQEVGEGNSAREAGLLARLGRCLWEAGETEQAGTVSARGAALLASGPPSPLRARLLAEHARMLMLLGRFEQSAAVSERAVEMASGVGSDVVVLAASITRGVDAVMTGRTADGLAVLRHTCRLADAGEGLEDLVRAHGNLAAALGRLGRFQESVAAADEGLAELGRRGLPATVHGPLLTNACESLVALGRWDEAVSRLQEALALHLPPSYEPFLLRMLGELETARGRYEQAESCLASAGKVATSLSEPQYLAPYHLAVATLAADRGQHDRAQQSVQATLGISLGTAQEDVAVLACLVGLRAAADEAARLRLVRGAEPDGAHAEGERLWQRAQALTADLERAGGDLPDCRAALAQCRAERERLHGAGDPTLWAAAADAWRVRGKPYATAWALYRQAECLLSRRQGVAAAALLREARDTSERLGARPLHDALLGLARRARIDLTSSAPPVGVPAMAEATAPRLTPRELQVLQCLAGGSTNREIARTLFISLKTVDNHVTHVMDKLQARNRVEAAAAGLRLGLVPALPERAAAAPPAPGVDATSHGRPGRAQSRRSSS